MSPMWLPALTIQCREDVKERNAIIVCRGVHRPIKTAVCQYEVLESMGISQPTLPAHRQGLVEADGEDLHTCLRTSQTGPSETTRRARSIDQGK